MELPADKLDYNSLIAEFIRDSREIIIKAKIAELYKQYGEYSLWLLISSMEKYQPGWKGLAPSKQAIYELCKAEIERHKRKEQLEIMRLKQANDAHWVLFGIAILGVILSAIALVKSNTTSSNNAREHYRHCYCRYY